jgi:hypothetical protein
MFIDVAAGRLYKGQNLWQEKLGASCIRNQMGVVKRRAAVRWRDALRSRPQRWAYGHHDGAWPSS